MKLVGINKFRAGCERPRILLAQLCCVLFFWLFMGNEALALFRPDLMVRLASEGDSSYVGEGVFEPSAATQSKSQAAYPGLPAQFRVLLKNGGDRPDRFLLTGPAGGSGFTVGYLDQGGVDRGAALSGGGYLTGSLAPGESVALLVQVSPTLFTLGASYRVAISAVSAGEPAAVDQVKTETVACSLTAAVTVSAPPDGAGAPGSQVSYAYTVTNVGSADNAFVLALDGGGWQGTLYADDGAGGGTAGDGIRQGGETRVTSSTGVLQPGNSYRFFVVVAVPESGTDGVRGEARLSATGDGAGGADQVATSVVAPVISVGESVRNLTRGGVFAPDTDAVPGDVLQYRMSVTNSGSAPATSVGIDSPLPPGLTLVAGSLGIFLAPEGGGAPCPLADCGWARESAGNIVARLGQGATGSAGGTLLPGKTLYLLFHAQVN